MANHFAAINAPQCEQGIITRVAGYVLLLQRRGGGVVSGAPSAGEECHEAGHSPGVAGGTSGPGCSCWSCTTPPVTTHQLPALSEMSASARLEGGGGGRSPRKAGTTAAYNYRAPRRCATRHSRPSSERPVTAGRAARPASPWRRRQCLMSRRARWAAAVQRRAAELPSC